MTALRRTAIAVAVVVLALGAAALYGVTRFRAAVADATLPRAETTVLVPSGATGKDIARLLAARGVIGSAFVFETLAALRRERAAMHAGEFRFAPHESAGAVLAQLVSGGGQLAAWVTVPEGFTARETAAAVAARGLAPADALARVFASDRLVVGGARTASLEGYLFPDTYLVPLGAGPRRIAGIFTDEFCRKLPPDAAALARRLGYTVPQVVTVASLVEREAKADAERPLMAGVYYNRLRLRMPLQVDATIEYVFPRHKDVITYADLRIDSPYNTYLHPGLPPTPIANPGQASLDAAFRPKPSDYLYYVYMGNGRSAFSRTLAEHQANVARYLH